MDWKVAMGFVLVWAVAGCASSQVRKYGDTGTVKISLNRVAKNAAGLKAKLIFFDAGNGCPEKYEDVPGAPGYFGASGIKTSTNKELPINRPVHIWLQGRGAVMRTVSAPSDQKVAAARNQMIQVVLKGEKAELEITDYVDHKPVYVASGDVKVVPANDCLKTSKPSQQASPAQKKGEANAEYIEQHSHEIITKDVLDEEEEKEAEEAPKPTP